MKKLSEAQRQRICSEARKWLGVPFALFGNDHNGVSCSAFVANIYRTVGINLAPKADWMFLNLNVIPPDKLQPGDVVFFCRNPRPRRHIATHVAIYIGDGKVINSRQQAGEVSEQLLSEIPGLITEKNPAILHEWIQEFI